MSINPGVTAAKDAIDSLSNSAQIDGKQLRVSDVGISAVWNPDPIDATPTHVPAQVDVTFEKGLVQAVSLGPLPFRVEDLVKLIGDPDEVSLTVVKAERNFLIYSIYYSPERIRIDVDFGEWTGPDPHDYVSGVIMNTQFSVAPRQGHIQPWLGYGHIQEYVPDLTPPNKLTPSSP